MRGDQRKALHAVILMRTRIDRRDRGAIGMAEQQAAAKADLVEQFWQYVERLDMHVVERPRQFHRRRIAVACARIDEHAGAGRGLKSFGKVAPQSGRSEAFMQHHNGRRALGRRADHAVFEMRGADGEEARGGKGRHAVSFPKVTPHSSLMSSLRTQGPIRRGLSVHARCARPSITTRAGGYGSLLPCAIAH